MNIKKLIKRIKRSIDAFHEPDEPQKPEKQFMNLFELIDEAQKAHKLDPRVLYEEKVKASHLAKRAHLEQNKQIDRYFTGILEKHIDPAILDLYREQGAPVPQLSSNIHFFSDEKQVAFGRRITIFFREHKIGDAIFTAQFQEGVAKLKVEEKIKVKESASNETDPS